MAGVSCLALIGDKAFDAHWLRAQLAGRNIEAVIPLREGTTGYAAHDAEKYKWRHLVENFFCAIKAFRRIATRYEKKPLLNFTWVRSDFWAVFLCRLSLWSCGRGAAPSIKSTG